ncbi:helix-turn-helix transcriptional regulator [Lactobacillus sp. S2-2]|uniref:helix-turn-helix transcriptional regulator n=1 Tax=Lactobacillus sp. S2-2 TaxID=2692917 RepID=UPI001F3FE9E2|nr:helix-turn-helix transcriptional regulator [Lactobacillus sp. S2-2]
MQFKNKLLTLRNENKLSQEELGNKLYVSRKTVSSWENGRTLPDIQTIITIAELFNVSLDYLLYDDKELINKYENNSKVDKKFSYINRISYFANTFLILVLHLTIINPFNIKSRFIILFLNLSMFIWLLTFKDWKKIYKHKIKVILSFLAIFLVEFNIRISLDSDIMNNLTQLFSNKLALASLLAIGLKSFFISISILIILFGYDKKEN